MLTPSLRYHTPTPHTYPLLFFSNHPATTEIYTLSLHDALPIWPAEPWRKGSGRDRRASSGQAWALRVPAEDDRALTLDRKSTRLNSSHPSISYAVFCLKKKKTNKNKQEIMFKVSLVDGVYNMLR